MATANKLTYLNTTKNELKETLNLGGANITDETFREYSSILKQKLLDYMLNGTQDIYNNWPKIEITGTNFTFDAVENTPITFFLNGNISQNNTNQSPSPDYKEDIKFVEGGNIIKLSGKNLAYTNWGNNFVSKIFNNTKATIVTKDGRNCLYYTYEAGYNSYDNLYLFKTSWQENTQYTISCYLYTNSSDANISIDYTDNTSSKPSGVSTNTWTRLILTSSPNKTIKHIRTEHTTGVTYIDLSTFMIEVGTNATEYQEFVNKVYPISLITSKNILNKEKITYGYELNGDTGELQELSSWWTSDYIPVEPNTSYITTNGVSSPTKIWYDENKQFILRNYNNPATSPSTARYLRVNGTITQLNNYPNVQVEKGTSSSSYVAYSTYKLCKIGTYQDYFYKANNNWYLHKEIGEITLNGSESWSINEKCYMLSNIFNAQTYSSFDANNPLAYSTHFKWGNGTTSNYVYGSFWYNETGRNIYVQKDQNPTSSTLSTFKTWLGSNNVKLYYALATPKNTLITNSDLINVLNACVAVTYQRKNNIVQTNDNLPFILNLFVLDTNI